MRSNSKLVSIWELSLILDGIEHAGTNKLAPVCKTSCASKCGLQLMYTLILTWVVRLEQVSFRTVDSPAKFQPHGAPQNASVSNVGKVQAHNNSMYSIAPVRSNLIVCCAGVSFGAICSHMTWNHWCVMTGMRWAAVSIC